jgi:ribosomal protein S13
MFNDPTRKNMSDILYTIGKTAFYIIITRYIIQSTINFMFRTKSLTDEEIEAIRLSVESDCLAKKSK